MATPLMIELRRVGDRYLATITLTPAQSQAVVDAANGHQKMSAHGSARTKAAALVHAADLAKKLFSNPVIAAILPPQAAPAIKAISAIGKLAAAGKLRSIWRRFRGPAMRRLARAVQS